MPPYGSVDGFLLVGGYVVAGSTSTGKPQGIGYKVTLAQEPSHGIGDGNMETTPTGFSKSEMTQEGAFFDTTTSGLHAMMGAAGHILDVNSVPRVACLGFAGCIIGRPFIGMAGDFLTEYSIKAAVEKLQKADVAHTLTGIVEDDGVVLHGLTAETADGTSELTASDHTTEVQTAIPITSNSMAAASVVTTPVPHGLTIGDTVLIAGVAGSSPTINGEQTATVLGPTTFSVAVNTSAGSGGTGGSFTRGKTNNGGALYVQLTALTLGGFTSLTLTLRHSVDNITFADKVSATTRTTIGAERVTFAGALNRYASVSRDFVGAGAGASATFMAGVVRG